MLMTKRELRKLAKRIADLEKVIQANENQEKVTKAQRKIYNLSSKINDPEDMFLLDELIQQELES